jgi:UDP-N-acetylglucosamine 2-epimerase (non-hydrolysing)
VKLGFAAEPVLSDSGIIAEESSILGFLAITLRDAIERPEAIDDRALITAGVTRDAVLDASEIALQSCRRTSVPAEYFIDSASVRVVNFILSTVVNDYEWFGIRQ